MRSGKHPVHHLACQAEIVFGIRQAGKSGLVEETDDFGIGHKKAQQRFAARGCLSTQLIHEIMSALAS
jgi:hypothetical protein